MDLRKKGFQMPDKIHFEEDTLSNTDEHLRNLDLALWL